MQHAGVQMRHVGARLQHVGAQVRHVSVQLQHVGVQVQTTCVQLQTGYVQLLQLPGCTCTPADSPRALAVRHRSQSHFSGGPGSPSQVLW